MLEVILGAGILEINLPCYDFDEHGLPIQQHPSRSPRKNEPTTASRYFAVAARKTDAKRCMRMVKQKHVYANTKVGNQYGEPLNVLETVFLHDTCCHLDLIELLLSDTEHIPTSDRVLSYATKAPPEVLKLVSEYPQFTSKAACEKAMRTVAYKGTKDAYVLLRGLAKDFAVDSDQHLLLAADDHRHINWPIIFFLIESHQDELDRKKIIVLLSEYIRGHRISGSEIELHRIDQVMQLCNLTWEELNSGVPNIPSKSSIAPYSIQKPNEEKKND